MSNYQSTLSRDLKSDNTASGDISKIEERKSKNTRNISFHLLIQCSTFLYIYIVLNSILSKKIRQIELIFFGLEFCGVKLVGTHLALPDKLCRSFAINIWTTFLSSLTLLSMPLLFSIQGQTLYYVALFPI